MSEKRDSWVRRDREWQQYVGRRVRKYGAGVNNARFLAWAGRTFVGEFRSLDEAKRECEQKWG